MAPSRSSTPIRPPPAIAPTCPKTISRARRRPSGSRCMMPPSMPTGTSRLSPPAPSPSTRAPHRLALEGGRSLDYGALILATGADPVRLALPNAGTDLHVLRTLADSDAIIAAAAGATRAVVLGASFIGLEAAASLRARGLEVHVAAPEARPLERVLGPQLGDFIRALHEEHGVISILAARQRAFGHNTVESRRRIVASPPISSSPASACVPRSRSPRPPDWPWTAASWSTTVCGRAPPMCMPPAMSRVGPTRTPARRFAWSTGWWLSARGRRRRATSSARISGSMPFLSSGANTTTSRSTTSVMPSVGTRSSWMAIPRPATAR